MQSEPFEIYPALDITKGDLARSPKSTFHSFKDALNAYEIPGISWLHLVDLDFAYKRGSNKRVLQEVIDSTSLRIQISGGIQDVSAVEYVKEFQPHRINLAPDFLQRKSDLIDVLNNHECEISVALDISGDRVVSRATGHDFGDAAPIVRWLQDNGCERIVLTEVARDGKLEGVNVELYKQFLDLTDVPIVASGGVSTVKDIIELRNIGIAAVVIGAALHHGNISLESAISTLESR